MSFWVRGRGKKWHRGRGFNSGHEENYLATDSRFTKPSNSQTYGRSFGNRLYNYNGSNNSNRPNNPNVPANSFNRGQLLTPSQTINDDNPYLRIPTVEYQGPTYNFDMTDPNCNNVVSSQSAEFSQWQVENLAYKTTTTTDDAGLATCNVIRVIQDESSHSYFESGENQGPEDRVTKYFENRNSMQLPGYSELRPVYHAPASECEIDPPYNIEYRNSDLNSFCSRCRCSINDPDGNVVMPEIKDRRNCIKCQKNIGNFNFKGYDGWLCINCSPPTRHCKNKKKGCSFDDISVKTWKHEMYFCLFAGKCSLCKEKYEIGRLYEHYRKHHAKETVYEGAKFRVKNKEAGEHAPDIEFIVLADFGPAVCSFYLKGGLFRISIHSPLHSSELHNYKCEFEISEPFWKTKTTYTIQENYLQLRDWFLYSTKNDFARKVDWTGKADVAIRISRIVMGSKDEL